MLTRGSETDCKNDSLCLCGPDSLGEVQEAAKAYAQVAGANTGPKRLNSRRPGIFGATVADLLSRKASIW